MKTGQLRNLTRQYGNVGYALVGIYLLARSLWQRQRASLAFGFALCALLAAWVGGHNQVEPSAKAQYTVTDLGTLPKATECAANGLNNQGQIVGVCVFANGVQHAFTWQDAKMTDLHTGRERSSEATAINSKGEVIGWFGQDAYTSSRPCLWRNGRKRDLGAVTNHEFGQAYSINTKGQIVGASYNSKEGSRRDDSAFLWQNGKLTPLHLSLDEGECGAMGISSKGQIVGWFNWMRDYRAFSYNGRSGKAEELPSLQGDWAGANGVNDAGQIAGQADLGPRGIPGYGYLSHACLWQRGKAIDLGTLGGGKSNATSINNKGGIVGWSYVNDAPKRELHAFLWQKGKMRDLNALLPKNSGWTLEQASSINDKGQVVGTGLHNGQRRAFLLTPAER